MDPTIIAAIITAIAVVVAAFVGRRLHKKHTISKSSYRTVQRPDVRTGDIEASGDVIVSGRDTVVYSQNKNRMTDSDKNLFTLGYYHGIITTRIICPFPREKVLLDNRVHFALNGLLEQIQYNGRGKYLDELTNLLSSSIEKKDVLHGIGQILSPLKKYIENQHKGRGNASFVLGMNLPQIERCITMFKVIYKAKMEEQVEQAELLEQLWAKVKGLLYDHHIDNLKSLVLFEDLPTDLKKSLNLILSSNLHDNRKEIERELANIGAFYDVPLSSGS